ncbi:signal peptidase I [Chloroflexus sp.]|uniref:signal peptidase I n=1 Tax=Chloroflexus sp. TaxID=1904827 RepID=UPI00260ED7F7|nr:signal peptidase I [uncultured Chloroflexus sp.]
MNDSPLPSDQTTIPSTSERLRQPRAPLRYVVRELLETAIFILLVFLIVRGVVQNFKIEGSSMEPTLHTGQYILVNKLIYFHFDLNAPLRLLPGQSDLPPRVVYPFRPPQRGDIIVFEYPRDVRKDYIKRVIGLPGDVIEIREGKVYVNDELLDEPYLRGSFTYCLSGYPCAQGPVTVPPGSIFVMGDNRGNSSDSREWDALPLDRVVGQAWLIYFPLSDWGLVPHHDYDTVTAAQP